MSIVPVLALTGAVVLGGAAISLPAASDAAQPAARGTAATAPATTTDPAHTFDFDSVHSCALFRVQHLGAGQFYGRFNTLNGSFGFDAEAVDAAPTALMFDVSIPVDSVDTNNERLDGHLTSPDFFNAVEHPAMTFQSLTSRKTGDRMYEVNGNFTMLGVTKPVVAKVEWTGTRAGRRGTRAGFEAIFTIKRSEYGMEWGVENGSLGDETRIIVNIEGTKK